MTPHASPPQPAHSLPRRQLNDRTKLKIQLFLLALPMLAFVFVFNYLPLFGWSYAFVDYTPGVSLWEHSFVGLKYFTIIFSGVGDFFTVIRNTLVISVLGLLCSPIPVVFAILLAQMKAKRLSRFIQTATSIPNFISWILVYAIFFTFFSGEDGVINKLLMTLHVTERPLNVLGNNDLAWYFQTFVGLWKGTGWGAIIYIAAMAGIDPELYDAADVDGAGRFQKIWHITVPGILPTFFVLLLLSISNMLSNGFEQFYVFQNPMVLDKLEVFDTYIYRMGISNLEFAFSTAMGMFKSVISVTLLTCANVLSKFVRGETII